MKRIFVLSAAALLALAACDNEAPAVQEGRAARVSINLRGAALPGTKALPVAADEVLVRNLNTSLRAAEGEQGRKNRNLSEALDDAYDYAGFAVENLTPRGSRDIVWNQDTDEFSLLEKAPDTDAYKFWKIYAGLGDVPTPQTYSIYAKGTDWVAAPATLAVGFDVGRNAGISGGFNFETDLDGTSNYA